jgi:hypothetical protein
MQEVAKKSKFQGMKKKKMGRPPKAEADKMKRRITMPLTETDFGDLQEYEKLTGKGEHAQTVRELFLEALRKRLAKLKKSS